MMTGGIFVRYVLTGQRTVMKLEVEKFVCSKAEPSKYAAFPHLLLTVSLWRRLALIGFAMAPKRR